MARKKKKIADLLTALGLANQTANIIMQLSHPGVGYGVHESRVESGSAFHSPLRRARSTQMFLSIAAVGDDADRDAYRKVIRRVHDHVVSGPESPEKYSGNSPKLQLWVALCLFRYFVDQYELVHRPLTDAEKEDVLRSGMPLATTLEVRPEMWPTSVAEYERMWAEMIPGLRIDPPIRERLEQLASLRFLVGPWGWIGKLIAFLLGPLYHFLTRATLPAEFRALMGWEWTRRDARWFRLIVFPLKITGLVDPWPMRILYRLSLMDFRFHMAGGRDPLWGIRLRSRRAEG